MTAVTPDEEISWEVTYFGRPVASWTYRLTTVDEGTLLEECVTDRRGAGLRVVSPWITGSRDRAARNSATMTTSLERIKAIAEATGR